MQVVLLREAFDHAVLVMPDPRGQVAGDADIERAVGAVGHDVDAGEFHGVLGVMRSLGMVGVGEGDGNRSGGGGDCFGACGPSQ